MGSLRLAKNQTQCAAVDIGATSGIIWPSLGRPTVDVASRYGVDMLSCFPQQDDAERSVKARLRIVEAYKEAPLRVERSGRMLMKIRIGIDTREDIITDDRFSVSDSLEIIGDI